MTNHWADIGNATLVIAWGANPSENHPACMAHINRARTAPPHTLPGGQTSNKPAADLWVIDPRKTRTALQASRYIRIRPGTDIAFFNGVASYIIESLEAASDFTAQQRANMVAFLNRSSDNQAWRNDAGTTTTVSGRSKYTDARLLVNAAGTDYDRGLFTDGTNNITNFPKFGSAYNAVGENTVYNKFRQHVAHYTPAKAAEICGCNAQDIIDVARKLVDNSRCSSVDGSNAVTGDPTSQYYRSSTLLYAMGITQHTYGSQNVKSFAVLQTLLGNAGRAGGGINALRGIHNVQGSTDMGLLYGNIPAYSGNPSAQPYEDTNAFGKYIDALWGSRLSGGTRATVSVLSGAGETIRYAAKNPGVAGNAITLTYVNPGAAGVLSVAVATSAITVTLAHDGTNPTSTANAVAAAVNADAAASALVGAAVVAGGTTVVAATGPTSLAGGTNVDFAGAYPASAAAVPGNLQQMGFYSMTRKWFGDATYFGKADIDKIYSLWPKVNGTNHIQMFRNMADTGTGQSDTLTFSGTPGTITLTKKGIKAGTIAIAGSVEGTDFKVAYPTGVITRIAAGNIGAGATVTVTYDYGITACVVWGQNPAVTEPNQTKVRAGLFNLDTLVVTDMFATETVQCDRKPTGVTYFIPVCAHVEKAGSVTNSGRTLQWRYASRVPRGNSRSDLFLLFKMAEALDSAGAFSHISSVWSSLSTAKTGGVYANLWAAQYGFVEANWDPTLPPTTPGNPQTTPLIVANDLVAENVYREMCTASASGGTIWIYTGAWGADGANDRPTGYPNAWVGQNRAKSRDNRDAWGTLAFPRWGWSWLVNRRVLYNNGDVWRAGTALAADEPDGYQGPDKCARLFVSNNAATIDYADGNYRTIHRLADVPKTPGGANPAVHVLPGRFPSHTEPYETPREDFANTYGYNSSGIAGNCLLAGTPRGTVANYPLVLTTIRCVEHFQGGPITRNNLLNAEIEPEPWIEINSVDALKYGIGDGDKVRVQTARGDSDLTGSTLLPEPPAWGAGNFGGRNFRARVGVGLSTGQRVGPGVVAIPWHWGDKGLSTGARANDLCIDAMDANTTIPEYKACLCKIEKA